MIYQLLCIHPHTSFPGIQRPILWDNCIFHWGASQFTGPWGGATRYRTQAKERANVHAVMCQVATQRFLSTTALDIQTSILICVLQSLQTPIILCLNYCSAAVLLKSTGGVPYNINIPSFLLTCFPNNLFPFLLHAQSIFNSFHITHTKVQWPVP